MPTPSELEAKFWKALKSDMTLMLGLDGVEEGHARPMTAQIEGDEGGPLWFFTATDNHLVKHLGDGDRQSRHSRRRGMTCSRPCMAA
jgi:general stress protein 26